MKKDLVLTTYCLNDKNYWNGHFIVTLANDLECKAIIKMKNKITKNDKHFLSRFRNVYYV